MGVILLFRVFNSFITVLSARFAIIYDKLRTSGSLASDERIGVKAEMNYCKLL